MGEVVPAGKAHAAGGLVAGTLVRPPRQVPCAERGTASVALIGTCRCDEPVAAFRGFALVATAETLRSPLVRFYWPTGILPLISLHARPGVRT